MARNRVLALCLIGLFAISLAESASAATGRKNYVLLNDDNSDSNVQFSSRQPRGAALKAASRGHTNIRLREKGTNRIFVFTEGKKLAKEERDSLKWPEDWKVKYRKYRVKKKK